MMVILMVIGNGEQRLDARTQTRILALNPGLASLCLCLWVLVCKIGAVVPTSRAVVKASAT